MFKLESSAVNLERRPAVGSFRISVSQACHLRASAHPVNLKGLSGRTRIVSDYCQMHPGLFQGSIRRSAIKRDLVLLIFIEWEMLTMVSKEVIWSASVLADKRHCLWSLMLSPERYTNSTNHYVLFVDNAPPYRNMDLIQYSALLEQNKLNP